MYNDVWGCAENFAELRTVSYSLSFFTMFFSVILWHTLLVPLPSYGEIWQQALT